MNRSFMSPEKGLQTSVRQRPQLGSLSTSSIKEKEEELALFLETRRREKELNYHRSSEEFDAPLVSVAGSPTGFSQLFNIESATPARKNSVSVVGSPTGFSQLFNIESATPARKNGGDDFLNSESDKNDYEWLLTPPISPRFPPLERESPSTVTSSDGSSNSRTTTLESRVANSQSGSTARSNLGPKQSPILFPSLNNNNNSSTATRRLSSSGVPGSRSVTPNTRATLTKSKSTPKPTPSTADKPTSTTTSKPIPSIVAKPRLVRSSTPPPRSTSLSAKSTLPARSSTPTPRSSVSSTTNSTLPSKTSTPSVRSNARSSTPTARSTGPASNPTVRVPTPTRRPTNTSAPPIRSLTTNTSAPPIRSLTTNTSAPPIRSLTTNTSASPIRSLATTNSVSPSANSSIVKPRTWKPSEMPGYSLDAPPNLRTSLPGRPVSATRGRVSAPNVRSSSVEPVPNGRVRRQSCSPSRGRAANVSGSSVPVTALSRLQSKAKDIMSPVLYGTKMVERMVNMRKLAPPKQDDKASPRNNLSGKSSSSPDNPGFGRTLSKKSLDMAIRHMDIRQRILGNPRPSMTNIPASSLYSVRMGPSQSRPISISDTSHATSSNFSSEMSDDKGV